MPTANTSGPRARSCRGVASRSAAERVDHEAVVPAGENLGGGSSCEQACSTLNGAELEITDDQVMNTTTGKAFAQVKMPASLKGIMDAFGLIPYADAAEGAHAGRLLASSFFRVGVGR